MNKRGVQQTNSVQWDGIEKPPVWLVVTGTWLLCFHIILNYIGNNDPN